MDELRNIVLIIVILSLVICECLFGLFNTCISSNPENDYSSSPTSSSIPKEVEAYSSTEVQLINPEHAEDMVHMESESSIRPLSEEEKRKLTDKLWENHGGEISNDFCLSKENLYALTWIETNGIDYTATFQSEAIYKDDKTIEEITIRTGANGDSYYVSRFDKTPEYKISKNDTDMGIWDEIWNGFEKDLTDADITYEDLQNGLWESNAQAPDIHRGYVDTNGQTVEIVYDRSVPNIEIKII